MLAASADVSFLQLCVRLKKQQHPLPKTVAIFRKIKHTQEQFYEQCTKGRGG